MLLECRRVLKILRATNDEKKYTTLSRRKNSQSHRKTLLQCICRITGDRKIRSLTVDDDDNNNNMSD